jgi:hypothetical protein
MDIIDSIYQGVAYIDGWKFQSCNVHSMWSVRNVIGQARNTGLEEAQQEALAEAKDCGCGHKIAEAIRKLKS